MTAVEYREYTLLCDYGGSRCHAQYGPFQQEIPRARLRRLAAREGWTHVHRDGYPRSYDKDFCPAHRPGPDLASVLCSIVVSMKVYCAAPMRGYPEHNHPAIDEAVGKLRALGHEVFSPAEHDRDNGKDPADGEVYGNDPAYMRQALATDLAWILSRADVVVVLPGWERSKGVQAEVHAALAVGMGVWELAGFLAGEFLAGDGSVTWERLHK